MKKKLTLRIVPFNKMLAVELLEIEGNFKESYTIRTNEHGFSVGLFSIRLPYSFSTETNSSDAICFNNNAERDAYQKQLCDWITDYAFNGAWSVVSGDIYTWETTK